MKKPTIEVKCDAEPQDLLTFRHDPYALNPDTVWVGMVNYDDDGGRPFYIKMSCERARALGEALLKVYGNDEEPTKITI